jgi:hypothetical protein
MTQPLWRAFVRPGIERAKQTAGSPENPAVFLEQA